MARGINKVILIGNLGADPEVRYSQNSTCFANLSLATSETWKDKQGQQQEKTEWHRVVIVGKLAEIAGEYLKKGSKVYVEGKLETRKWQDQQGQDKYTTEIKVDSFNGVMQMLDSREGGQGGQQQGFVGQQANPAYTQGTNAQQPNPRAQQQTPPPGGDDFDPDIPF